MRRTTAGQIFRIGTGRAGRAKTSPETIAVNKMVADAAGKPARLKELWAYMQTKYPEGLPESEGWHTLSAYAEGAGWPKSEFERTRGQKTALAKDLLELKGEMALSKIRNLNLEAYGLDGKDEAGDPDPDERIAIRRARKIRDAAVKHQIDPVGAGKLIHETLAPFVTGKITERARARAGETERLRKEELAAGEKGRAGEIAALKVEEAPLLEEDKRLAKRIENLRNKEFAGATPAVQGAATAQLNTLLGEDRAGGKGTVLGSIKERLAEIRKRKAGILRWREPGEGEDIFAAPEWQPPGAEPKPREPGAAVAEAPDIFAGPEWQPPAPGAPAAEPTGIELEPEVAHGPDFEMARGQIEAGESLDILEGMKLTKEDIAAIIALYKARQAE